MASSSAFRVMVRTGALTWTWMVSDPAKVSFWASGVMSIR